MKPLFFSVDRKNRRWCWIGRIRPKTNDIVKIKDREYGSVASENLPTGANLLAYDYEGHNYDLFSIYLFFLQYILNFGLGFSCLTALSMLNCSWSLFWPPNTI